MSDFATLCWWALLAHIVADWFLQNEWMALNKTSLRHPAAWVHSGIHTLAFLVVFPWWAAVVWGVLHLVIDTRHPLIWWRRLIRQTQDGPIMLTFGMWQDQMVHVATVIVLAWAVTR
jgi:hypothetical protein